MVIGHACAHARSRGRLKIKGSAEPVVGAANICAEKLTSAGLKTDIGSFGTTVEAAGRRRKAARPQDDERLVLHPRARNVRSMCGRYASFLPAEALSRMFATVNRCRISIPPAISRRASLRSWCGVRHPETGERHVDVLRWGVLPYFTKDAKTARRPINARAIAVPPTGVAWCRRRRSTNGKVIEGGKAALRDRACRW